MVPPLTFAKLVPKSYLTDTFEVFQSYISHIGIKHWSLALSPLQITAEGLRGRSCGGCLKPPQSP